MVAGRQRCVHEPPDPLSGEVVDRQPHVVIEGEVEGDHSTAVEGVGVVGAQVEGYGIRAAVGDRRDLCFRRETYVIEVEGLGEISAESDLLDR